MVMTHDRRSWLGLALLLALSCAGEEEQAPGPTRRVFNQGGQYAGDPMAPMAEVNGEPITLAEVDWIARDWADRKSVV